MNPMGKVPVLETPEGPVFESNAIARYVSRLNGENSLNGSSLIEYAHVEQWSDFSTLEIYGNILKWFGPRMGFMPYSAPGEEAAISALKRGLDALNTHLTSNTYLVGHSITLADIITVCNLNLGFATVMTKSFTSAFPHVERYFWTVINQPNFKKVVGDVKQTEAVPPIASKKAAQPAKPKEEPKKKAAPAAEAPKPVEEAEEAPKPKAKNPLDLLPPSPMVLDEWKRLYSNTKSNFREVAIKGFWDMYDPRDTRYGSVTTSTTTRTWCRLSRSTRGPEIPKFIMDEVYDMELYEWTKVDISDEAQKERVSQMIEDAEPFEGEALLDAKCFK
ncbi:hypothetical protein Bca52824_079337 [Brassica carinata]|uniref:Elongation factor 1-gamma n=1 Tax=Brassica carinata TaxID=52824 RepID=A0A8X7Q0X7_BRACI|nr:hypothetical protein Bca52824_079337 [Brassica carinata]